LKPAINIYLVKPDPLYYFFFEMMTYLLVTPIIFFFCMADTTFALKRSEEIGA
jgi:hypothetical protein